MVKSNNLSTQKTVLIVKPFEAGAGAAGRNDSGLQLLVLLLLLRLKLDLLVRGLIQVHYHGFAFERHLLDDRLLVDDLLLGEGRGNFIAGRVKVAELLFLRLQWVLQQQGRFFHRLYRRVLRRLLRLQQLFRWQDAVHAG
uniref:(northern house mosquito) hypothetical protein n=1 Tax=Culex pipiens TaxID=7175 RepID=A0A8D8EVF6_CULPI